MLHQIIYTKTQEWLQSEDCAVKSFIEYIRKTDKLRQAQIEAIEVYLFLKIKGDNKPLWQLFAEGFFINTIELDTLNINTKARQVFTENTAALALYDFCKQPNSRLKELELLIVNQPETIDYQRIIKSIFYQVDYADYLMSLPMGAGKTFLMAAIIYIDLYFSLQEPQNPVWANNFLVLVPSGLKSSIVPSLRDMENFDGSWVLPIDMATKIKRMMRFEILDANATKNKSNQTNNPNANIINNYLPNPFAHVFVVNAEKVILDRLDLSKEGVLIEKTEEEKDVFANELRSKIAEIPNLSILIDEVHHAATDNIKLRQVVNKWTTTGNIKTVFGFSGTPYLSNTEKIYIKEKMYFSFSQITNTVYYFPLVNAVQAFLKKPNIKFAEGLERLEIIKKGVTEFQATYQNTVYPDGTIAKQAIYCTSIEVLENIVYPFLIELGIDENEILKYHKGNKDFSIPKQNEIEFKNLDTEFSKKRYILLVQVGKEGWNCKSLASVILSQKGDSPKNMVLQTACRCLRQVSKTADEIALIWLNEYNAEILNTQLQKEQNTSIEALNNLKGKAKTKLVQRFPRIDTLNLPKIQLWQLQVKYNIFYTEEEANTNQKLQDLANNLDRFQSTILIQKTDLNGDIYDTQILENIEGQPITFNRWLYDITKASFKTLTISQLNPYKTILKTIFNQITTTENEQNIVNTVFDVERINAQIRLAFAIKRDFETSSEAIDNTVELLFVDKLTPVEENKNLYPNEAETQKILEADKTQTVSVIDEEKILQQYEILKANLSASGMINYLPPFKEFKKTQTGIGESLNIKNKTYHYLPYNFKASTFELDIFKNILTMDIFKNNPLEIYYNGERGLTGFVIDCFTKKTNGHYLPIGKYTPDFLIIQRNENKNEIEKCLILETKGSGFAEQSDFKAKRKYIETEFLKLNQSKFDYQVFDFLYIEDSEKIPQNIAKINNRIKAFFGD